MAKKALWVISFAVSSSLFLAIADPSNSSETPSCFSQRNFYVRDPIRTKQLAFWEQSLVAVLIEIKNGQSLSNTCHLLVAKYLLEYERDTKAVQGQTGVLRASVVAENPILIFRLVHRLVEELNFVKNACKSQKEDKIVLDMVYDTFGTVDLTMPTNEDLNVALNGLSVTQYMYGLNATRDLRFGVFGNVQTNAQLYFDDFLLLAEKARISDAMEMAFQWLISAEKQLAQEKQAYLGNGDRERLAEAWQTLMNSTDAKSINELHSLLAGKRTESYLDYSEFSKYSMCRGENTRPLEYQASYLVCYCEHSWNPYLYINPLKIEVVAWQPTIYQFHNLISNRAIQAIRQKYTTSEDQAVPSTLETVQGFKRDNRKNSDLSNDNYEIDLQNLNKNIEYILGFKWTKEDMQLVLNTRLGAFCNVHQLRRTAASTEEPDNVLASVLIYMSDVEMGGLTAFYKIGAFARPMKGSVVVFHNIHENGAKQKGVAYKGCPVILGHNEWASKWIY